MASVDKYCESCIYACPWDYKYEKIMCSKNFKEREPFDDACEFYIPEKDHNKMRVLRGTYDKEEY